MYWVFRFIKSANFKPYFTSFDKFKSLESSIEID